MSDKPENSTVNRRQVVMGAAIAVAGAGLLSATAQAEAQPHMRAALESLRNARAELLNATADKGGHRARAINLVDQAITETQAGIAYDNRR